jgi:hypothetical protein
MVGAREVGGGVQSPTLGRPATRGRGHMPSRPLGMLLRMAEVQAPTRPLCGPRGPTIWAAHTSSSSSRQQCTRPSICSNRTPCSSSSSSTRRSGGHLTLSSSSNSSSSMQCRRSEAPTAAAAVAQAGSTLGRPQGRHQPPVGPIPLRVAQAWGCRPGLPLLQVVGGRQAQGGRWCLCMGQCQEWCRMVRLAWQCQRGMR